MAAKVIWGGSIQLDNFPSDLGNFRETMFLLTSSPTTCSGESSLHLPTNLLTSPLESYQTKALQKKKKDPLSKIGVLYSGVGSPEKKI